MNFAGVIGIAAAAAQLTQPPNVAPSPAPVVTTQPSTRPSGRPPARPLPEPSEAAEQLVARILSGVDLFEQEAHRTILNQVRWPTEGGTTCAFEHPECARVAEEIAQREAPRLAQEMRRMLGRVFGAQFARTMTAAQIEEASRFFGGDAGRALIGSLMAIDERTFAGSDPSAVLLQRRGALAAEFARRTKHLPRAEVGGAPVVTVPVAPPPPRQ